MDLRRVPVILIKDMFVRYTNTIEGIGVLGICAAVLPLPLHASSNHHRRFTPSPPVLSNHPHLLTTTRRLCAF